MPNLFCQASVVSAVVTSLCLLTVPGGAADDPAAAWKPILPARELDPLVEQLSQVLREPLDELSKGKLKFDDRMRLTEQARGLAQLIAASAQSTAADGAAARRHAALRDVALRLDKALRDEDVAAAKKLFQELPRARADDKTRVAPVPLSDAEGREDVVRLAMYLFRPRDRGGLGLEGTLGGLTRPGGGLKSEQVARFGYQLAVIAQVEQAAAPREKIGDKDPKDWRRFTDEMRAAGLALAKAAADDKTPAVRQAAERLSASCSNCHKVFRDN